MEMEGLKHMSHRHPLILAKYQNNPQNASCHVCSDILTAGTSVYRCSRTYGTSSSTVPYCDGFIVHRKCTEMPPHLDHSMHEAHNLSLCYKPHSGKSMFMKNCDACGSICRENVLYQCKPCEFFVCLKCAMQGRNLNHEFHNHPLTLLPLKSLFTCGACGVKGIEELSYLCQTCMFWIHKSCALAPKTLICKLHHHDHPLLQSDSSILKRYYHTGMLCSICRQTFDERYWLYYCADCRFFAHIQCATKSTDENMTKLDDTEDANHSELAQFPVCDDEHYLYYRLIQDFAKACSSASKDNCLSTTAGGISHCKHGHPLVLIDELMEKDIESNEVLCAGCFQPLSFSADSFYGCVHCKFYLHKVCSTELPGAMGHPSHPKHMLHRCRQIGKTIQCDICKYESNGIYYRCERSSCSFFMDIMCASLPEKIKHESHKHALKQQEQDQSKRECNGCCKVTRAGSFFSCKTCQFGLHVGCAVSPGTVKHRWDEHKLCLMYPPVKHHPHDFDCEFCSRDINPNYWFYHCRECDTSFHLMCIKHRDLFSNFDRHNLRFYDVLPKCVIL